jgi:hypothetical protein
VVAIGGAGHAFTAAHGAEAARVLG